MSKGPTARLFVALDLPPEASEELAGWARLVASALRAPRTGPEAEPARAGIRLLEEDSLHVTLCFLGSRPVTEIDGLADALGACVAPVGELSVGAPLLLPRRRPRALAVELHDRTDRLARLQAQVSDAVARASGWRPSERRGLRPHVTVARMRAATHWATGAEALPATPWLRFRPRAISLLRSWLEPAGASYETVASCELPSVDR